ncbi:ABC transporter substrate-binding protein [Lysinibacillus sphaericus]|uniref:Periplasmic-binding protein n=1 Tax=Lysinibacillus sphaericus OT4b.31 TaxID=1285586 RepID=R7ZIT2_LYSSH|nr:ABC transporter substrate-binding protein [Lysinibacillus sphaericus]EON74005.1 periplasmic-binding protein [Lysinibacillus sphaericus OT4b.31]
MKKRNIFFLGFLLIFALMLVGCGSKDNTTKESNGDSNAKEEIAATTKKVQTMNGEIEIPTKVERLVVDAYLPTSLLLGVKPVGATQRDLENVHIQNQIGGIASIGENSVEAILALKPDLILTASGEPEDYEKFSKIAPTIVIPYETYRSVEEEVAGLAEIFGKQAEGEAWLKMFEEKVNEHKERLASVMDENETVSIFGAFGKDFYLYGDGIYRGGQAIYKKLQLQAPERIQKELIDAGETYKQVSYEVLPEYAGDYIFLDESKGAELNKKDSLWLSIDAMKNNNVFYLAPDRFWPYDPIAVLAQVEEVANMLIEKKTSEK